jgi:hypothetical protein
MWRRMGTCSDAASGVAAWAGKSKWAMTKRFSPSTEFGFWA